MTCPQCGKELAAGLSTCTCGYEIRPTQRDISGSRTPRPLPLVLLASVATAMFVACSVPAVGTLAASGYTFDPQSYWEVFIHRHHNVATWFERGWPEFLAPIGVIMGPLIGGFLMQSLRRADTSPSRIVSPALAFAVSYCIAVLIAAALAQMGHPYPVRWDRFLPFQGLLQLLTLFVLAGALSALGAWAAVRFRARA